MKPTFFAALLAGLLACGAVQADIGKPGDHRMTIEHAGQQRMFLVHVPKRYDRATPAPLLIALHGGGGSMDHMADDARYGLTAKSERENFIVVFPNGFSRLPRGKLATWNAGGCCGQAVERRSDDVGFIRAMLGEVTKQLSIDRRKVFATGMSNGGLMAHRLACEMADSITAIAAVAGTDNTTACTPAQPVSVLVIHAKNDDHVLFGGGAGPASVDAVKNTNFVSVPQTVARWVDRNACNAQPRRVLDKPGAYCEKYTGCRNQTEVELCVTDSGGHSWPGGTKARAAEAPSQAMSANDVMWDFFMHR